ncbi:hypothetical protein [Microcoleus sp. FACHB-672]|uniref:hypothetical protein n=1 Tax=Microcoleus sp. FACHB-672 TaxID=2692825 RepID=UPI0016844777|nr:hypothetical protein [Microcoleus sp. FACHB-672]MBD2043380.1 hypothetical protein [Microcoleus sp. FACHB-672]
MNIPLKIDDAKSNIYGFTRSSHISLQEIYISVGISAQPDQGTGTVGMPASAKNLG